MIEIAGGILLAFLVMALLPLLLPAALWLIGIGAVVGAAALILNFVPADVIGGILIFTLIGWAITLRKS